MMMHACNPGVWEVEAGELQFEAALATRETLSHSHKREEERCVFFPILQSDSSWFCSNKSFFPSVCLPVFPHFNHLDSFPNIFFFLTAVFRDSVLAAYFRKSQFLGYSSSQDFPETRLYLPGVSAVVPCSFICFFKIDLLHFPVISVWLVILFSCLIFFCLLSVHLFILYFLINECLYCVSITTINSLFLVLLPVNFYIKLF